MHTPHSVDISTAEWRWVILISGFLVAFALLPYAWALAINETESEWRFMGLLVDLQDGATHLSTIEQGRQDTWLFELRYTPEKHDGAGFQTFYLFLGHTARLLRLSDLLVFHLTRMAASLLMYIALYQFAASVWVRLRPRRMFFALTAVGSGLGWLLILVKPDAVAADLNVPEAFPFYAAYANPHAPFSIACMTLIGSCYVIAFRRGFAQEPSIKNGGLEILLLSLTLALIEPQTLVVLSCVLVLYTLVRAYMIRDIPLHELRWGSMLWLPVLPLITYYAAVFHFNDIMRDYASQLKMPAPNLLLLVVGYGLLALLAVPGIWRAVRHFERDGDQFMLLWFIVNLVVLYLPSILQGPLLVMGLIVPLVYFGVRALEDFWFYKVPRKWRLPAGVALIILLVPSNILILIVPLVGVASNPEEGLETGMLLESGYLDTFQWLQDNGEEDAVVLAAPTVSLWVPANTPQVVVYGHPNQTVSADERKQQVLDWYRGIDCFTLLSDAVPFKVRYIMWGPQELALQNDEDKDVFYPDTGECLHTLPPERLEQTLVKDQVTLYVLRP